MKRFAILILLSCALPLAACSPTGSAGDGAGYSLLTPNGGTRTFITENDPAFRDQVAAHNIQCRKDEGCRK